MTQKFEGELVGTDLKVAIIVSRFNEVITKNLSEGAVNTLVKHGVNSDDISEYSVPGAFEIPVVAAKLATSKKFDAVICLGAVIQGDTPHFDQVVNAVTSGVARVAVDNQIPVVYGILTTNTLEQAFDRSGVKLGNKGSEAAVTAVEMANLIRKI